MEALNSLSNSKSAMIKRVKGKVYIIDDDESVRRSLSLLLRSEGYATESFEGTTGFLAEDQPDHPGCILLDIFMDGKSSLELHEILREKFNHCPVIYMTAFGDIPMSVTALKKGAVDFLQKPIDDSQLFKAVEEALLLSFDMLKRKQEINAYITLTDSLTPREFQIFQLVTSGMLNKQIALKLNIAEHTVKLHRGKITEKLGVHSVAEMVRIAERLPSR
jgi:FixJ family two-component response regulator